MTKTLSRTNWFVAVKPSRTRYVFTLHLFSLYIFNHGEFSCKRRSRGTVSLNSTKIGFRLVFSLAKVCKWTCLKGHEPSRKYKFWSLENQSLWAGRLECAPSCVIDGVKVNSMFLQWLFSPRVTSVGGSALRRRCDKSWQAGEKNNYFTIPQVL